MTYSVDDLLYVMSRLRDREHGCPWDLAQTMQSILPSTLEEIYELVDAIEQDDPEQIREELGDVLFQVVFFSQLGNEKGWFDFRQLVDKLVDKLLRRHPHVFAGGQLHASPPGKAGIADVRESWEQIKEHERKQKAQHSLLDDVPQALPALKRAQKLQKRASRVGFDWPDAAAALEKVDEEYRELAAALAGDESQAVLQEELGDLLFSCVNVARHLGMDAEMALRHAAGKFERRFAFVEQGIQARGGKLQSASLLQMDQLWQQAKERENT